MKAVILGVAALCAQLGQGVPHGPNQHHRHQLRHEVTDYSTVTDIVTITAHNAVVWVDQYNNIISTEFRDLPTSSAAASSVVVSVPVVTNPTSTSLNVLASSTILPSQTYIQSVSPILSSSDVVSSVPATSALISSTPAADSTPTSDSNIAVATTSVSGTGGDKVASQNDTSSAQWSGFGICYELIGTSGCQDQATLTTDFAFLASQGYTKVRTYDIGCNLGIVAAVAAAQGLQLIVGLNSISNVATDMATLVSMIDGNWNPIDTVVVGNEVVNNGGDPGAVVAALAVARPILTAAGFSKNVVTVDTVSAHETYPVLCQNSDYCAVNAHAYFDPNTSADGAGKFVVTAMSAVAKGANGKTVIITESGWPWQGSANGLAIPSTANQQAAINSLNLAFANFPGSLFIFQAYDATYKAPGPLGVEQYFGIYGH